MNAKVFTLIIVYLVCFSMFKLKAESNFFDVTGYGAKGDGIVLDTEAINRTIDSAALAGGGTVYFPAGNYLSFSIRLKSNVRLFIDQGASIIAATPGKHGAIAYDIPDNNLWGDSLHYQDFGHSHWKNSLIWGIGLQNITIEGQGMIDGIGLTRRGSREPGLGNKAIALKNCTNVNIRDITIFRGGHFAILPTGVDNFTIDNVKIDSNRDGIDIDCCKHVIITNCIVNTPNDDAIVLKSSYALGYIRTTENVVISNCIVSGYDVGTLLDGTYQTTLAMAPDKGGVTGRIKIGTESNGDFKNIAISNCVFNHCRGLAIETVDGAVIEDVVVNNLTMRDIVNSPFYLRLGARMRGPVDAPVGKLQRIIISNVTVSGVPPRYGALIMGTEGHNIADVDFNNIKIHVQGGAQFEQALVNVPELEEGYPDPRMYGDIPAYGFFVRHVQNIDFNNVEIEFVEADRRPAFILDDVTDARLFDIDAERTDNSKFIILKKCGNIKLSDFLGIDNQVVDQLSDLELP